MLCPLTFKVRGKDTHRIRKLKDRLFILFFIILMNRIPSLKSIPFLCFRRGKLRLFEVKNNEILFLAIKTMKWKEEHKIKNVKTIPSISYPLVNIICRK